MGCWEGVHRKFLVMPRQYLRFYLQSIFSFMFFAVEKKKKKQALGSLLFPYIYGCVKGLDISCVFVYGWGRFSIGLTFCLQYPVHSFFDTFTFTCT